MAEHTSTPAKEPLYPLSEDSLAEESLHLIDLIAQAISTTISTQLVDANNLLQQTMPPLKPASRKIFEIEDIRPHFAREATLDKVLDAVFVRKPLALYELGVRKPIAVDIGPFINPPLPPSCQSLRPVSQPQQPPIPFSALNRSTVPGKLIQQPTFERATREPTPLFTSTFTAAVTSAVCQTIRTIDRNGDDIRSIFAREQRLHKLRHRIPAREMACLWRLAEEDYEWPHPELEGGLGGPRGKLVIRFGFGCKGCKRRHEVLAWNSVERGDEELWMGEARR